MISQEAKETLFLKARTHSHWKDQPVADQTLHELYELMKMGPTSTNCCPLRIVFVRSKEHKEHLKSTLAASNIEKTMTAPVTAILAHDEAFYEKLPVLSPHNNAREWFVGNKGLSEVTAFRNGTLQGAYFILAARAVGLDCGPMSGFDNAKVDELFFSGTTIKSNFLCNLGYGSGQGLYPRAQRLSFEETCQIL